MDQLCKNTKFWVSAEVKDSIHLNSGIFFALKFRIDLHRYPRGLHVYMHPRSFASPSVPYWNDKIDMHGIQFICILVSATFVPA